ncbi:hypothetical protein DITRI_Ditri02bG0146900 [Diplodiscus trichospermus]
MDKNLVRVKGRGVKLLCTTLLEKQSILTFYLHFSCVVLNVRIRDVTNQNETALHIAAQNNQFEVLQVLVGWLRRTHHKDGKLWEKVVLNWRNKEGDTVLHVAVSNNQHEA